MLDRGILVLACVTAGAASAAAQEGSGGLRAGVDAGFGLVVGDASDFLDGGFGVAMGAGWRPTGAPWLELAVDGAWVALDPDHDAVSGASADNDLFTLTAGPVLRLPLGPVAVYGTAFAGGGWVRWETRTGRRRVGTRGATALGGAAGLELRVSGGAHPVALRAEGRVTDTGELAFGRAPAPSGLPGSAGIVEQDVAVLQLRLGARVTF